MEQIPEIQQQIDFSIVKNMGYYMLAMWAVVFTITGVAITLADRKFQKQIRVRNCKSNRKRAA